MNSVLTCLLLATVVASIGASSYYPSNSYGKVPALPPLGAPARHPKYGYNNGYGYSKGYGNSNGYGNNDYVIALRYESTTRGPYGEVESAYAYDVDGQTVRVARIDSPSKYY